ncbi:MAG: glycosyltransferase [Rubellimicrobium sp.]|nr:glycosyltransferase [Rubellimicrobium sp.]
MDDGRQTGPAPNRMIRARACLDRGDLAGARDLARKAQAHNPARPGPAILLARIETMAGRPEAAVSILTDFIGAQGSTPDLRRHLAEALFASGAFDEALGHLAPALGEGAGTVRDFMAGARIAFAQGDLPRAAHWAEEAARAAPDNPAPVRLIARIACADADPPARLRALESAMTDPQGLFHARLALAGLLNNLGRSDEAFEVARRITPAEGDDAQTLALSGMFDQCGRHDEARAALRRIGADGPHAAARLLDGALAGTLSPQDARAGIAALGPQADLFAQALAIHATPPAARGAMNDAALRARVGAVLGLRYRTVTDYLRPDPGAAAPLVSIVAPLHRREDEETLVQQILRQDYGNAEVVVAINGPGFDADALAARLRAGGGLRRVEVLDLPVTAMLPVALDAAIAVCRGAYIAKFDADDLYQERYLSRMVRFMIANRAAICGKPQIFMHFESMGCTALTAFGGRSWQRLSRDHLRVGSGSSMVFTRDLALALRFDPRFVRGEDRGFQARAIAAGHRILLAPPFDHVACRRAQKGRHVWRIGDTHLLAGALGEVPLIAGSADEADAVLAGITAAL